MIKLKRSIFGNWPKGPHSRLEHPTFFQPGFMGGGGGSTSSYVVNYSLRYRGANNAKLQRTFGTPTDNLKFTIRKCFKISAAASARGTAHFLFAAGDGTSNNFFNVQIRSSDDTLQIANLAGGVYNLLAYTDMKFRDPSAHYDVCIRYDSANATSTDRLIVEVNGVRRSLTYTNGPVAQNTAAQANVSGRAHIINSLDYTALYGDQTISEDFFIDGQALAASNFGEFNTTSGQWVPKRYAGTYGNNGHYLKFEDASANTAAAIGKDSSGNGNNWTPSGIDVVTAGATMDRVADTPTNNYATLDYLSKSTLGGNISYGNLRWASTNVGAGSNGNGARSTIGMTSGSWYAEITHADTAANAYFGVCNETASMNNYGGFGAGSWALTESTGDKINNATAVAYGTFSWAANNVYMIAFDATNGKIWWGVNGTWLASGNPAAGTNAAFTGMTGQVFFFMHSFSDNSGTNSTVDWNFGQRPFAYTPPTGFKALNTANLPTPAIPNGETGFAARLRTGSNSPMSVADLLFGTNLTLLTKSRTTADPWNLADSVRGTSKNLATNNNNTEDAIGRVTAFNSNGYTLGGGFGATNAAGQNFVDYAWRIGAAYGHDVVAYTGNNTAGRTVSHALGAVPHLMIVKARTNATNWYVYHRNLSSAAKQLYLNLTNAEDTSTAFNSTAPTSSVFTLGGAGIGANDTGVTYVTYLWTSIPGFSLIGSYVGNGNADGPFVWCGFRPKFVMVKNASAAATVWLMFDAARDTYNVMNKNLYAEQAVAEDTANVRFDFVSNGFKVRNTNASENGSGNTIIFAAFAEAPFKYANAR